MLAEVEQLVKEEILLKKIGWSGRVFNRVKKRGEEGGGVKGTKSLYL